MASSDTQSDAPSAPVTEAAALLEIEEALDAACKERDAAGFAGSPADCIRFLSAELSAARQQLAAINDLTRGLGPYSKPWVIKDQMTAVRNLLYSLGYPGGYAKAVKP